MMLAKITGNVVSSCKDENLCGRKLLIARQLDLEGNTFGEDIVAIDTVCAGRHDTVLLVREGSAAQQLLDSHKVPVHTVIVGIVDKLDVMEEK